MHIRRGEKLLLVIGSECEDLERFAAQELQRYLERMLDVEVLIKTEKEDGNSDAEILFLLGTPSSNEKISSIVKMGAVKPVDDPEGFIIKLIELDGKEVLVFCGKSGLSVRNSVYYFLERFCGIGFFRDGTRIPRREELTLNEVNCTRTPHFKYRTYFPHWWQGETRYRSSGLWVFEDWKKMIDWMEKKGFNVFTPFQLIEHGEIMRRAFPEDESVNKPSTFVLPEELRLKTAKEAINYARAKGFKIMYWFIELHASSSFIKKHGVKTHPQIKATPICPADPMFKEILERNVKATINVLGEPDIYMYTPWCEMILCEDVDSRWKPEKDFYEVVKQIDPKAEVVIWTWDWIINFLVSQSPSRSLRSFPLDKLFAEWEAHRKTLPKDIIIADWDRNYFLPTRGFEGHRWWLMHHTSFEGHDMPFTWHTPDEILAKDAADLGAESAENMVKCYGRLLDAAKNRLVFALICPAEASPMMGGILIHLHVEDVEKCLKKCEEALNYALKESDRQKGNPLYHNDILELKMVYRRVESLLHNVKGWFFYKLGRPRESLREFDKCIKSLESLLQMIKEDERFNISLTRKWLEENIPGANLKMYDRCAAIHRSFITCCESVTSLINSAKKAREKIRKEIQELKGNNADDK